MSVLKGLQEIKLFYFTHNLIYSVNMKTLQSRNKVLSTCKGTLQCRLPTNWQQNFSILIPCIPKSKLLESGECQTLIKAGILVTL